MTENSNYLYAHCMYNVKIPLAVQQLQKTEWANDISMNASSGAAPLVLNQFWCGEAFAIMDKASNA